MADPPADVPRADAEAGGEDAEAAGGASRPPPPVRHRPPPSSPAARVCPYRIPRRCVLRRESAAASVQDAEKQQKQAERDAPWIAAYERKQQEVRLALRPQCGTGPLLPRQPRVCVLIVFRATASCGANRLLHRSSRSRPRGGRSGSPWMLQSSPNGSSPRRQSRRQRELCRLQPRRHGRCRPPPPVRHRPPPSARGARVWP